MPTGAASGLLAVDVDPRNGGDSSLDELQAKHGQLPKTAEQITGGGGRHIVYRHRGGSVPKNLAHGIDLKGDGGYIVLAPSIHASGNRYQWDGVDGAKAILDPAEPPRWLVEYITAARSDGRAEGKTAAGDKWRVGERNDKLTGMAGAMRRRGASRETMEAALLEENRRRCDPPLQEAEVRRIAGSVASYEPDENRVRAAGHSSAFRLTDNSVLYIDPDPEKEPLTICGRLEVIARTRSENGEGWGRLLRWRDSENRLHEWAMPMNLLAGDGTEYRARLLDGGLFLAPGRKTRDLLTVYLQNAQPEASVLCVGHVGWHRDAFVLPGGTVAPDGAESVLLQSQHDEHLLKVVGTFEEWQANVGALCAGNSRLIVAVSCAFAGPLLHLVGGESGGIHFYGASSTGKSTALLVGGSVLGGGGGNGFVQSWRVTANGLEAVAELHNDLCLYLDELAQMDAREAAQTAYLLGNGSGKQRMTRNIGARRKLAWRLLFVSAGEATLADYARVAGERTKAGAEVRLLNIEADAGAGMGIFENIHGAGSPDAFARRMKDGAQRFYGAPLRPYLAFIVQHREAIEKAIRDVHTDFLRRVPAGASGEVHRAAHRFALIAAAGELATDARITGWTKGESMSAAARCFESWLYARGTAGAGDVEAGIKQVKGFLEVNGASRFQSTRTKRDGSGEPIHEKVVNRAGFRIDEDGETVEYLVFSEVFRSEVCEGFDHRALAKALAERGYLERQPPHLTKKRRLPEIGAVRVYAINSSLLAG
jgi:uncharacterized protein (DUF927 family)